MSAVSRIKLFIKEKNISVSKLEKMLSLGNGTLRTAGSRNSPLKEDTLVKMVQAFPDLSPVWLLLGEGDMYSYKNATRVSEPEAAYLSKSKEQSLLIGYMEAEMKELKAESRRKGEQVEELMREMNELRSRQP